MPTMTLSRQDRLRELRYHYVVVERARELSRKSTRDFAEHQIDRTRARMAGDWPQHGVHAIVDRSVGSQCLKIQNLYLACRCGQR
jgi:hypothetical protein